MKEEGGFWDALQVFETFIFPVLGWMLSTQKSPLFLLCPLIPGCRKESIWSLKKLTFPAKFTGVVGGSFKIDYFSFLMFLFLFLSLRTGELMFSLPLIWNISDFCDSLFIDNSCNTLEEQKVNLNNSNSFQDLEDPIWYKAALIFFSLSIII